MDCFIVLLHLYRNQSVHQFYLLLPDNYVTHGSVRISNTVSAFIALPKFHGDIPKCCYEGQDYELRNPVEL